MLTQRNSDGTFSCFGRGPLRPIVIDLPDREEARKEYTTELKLQINEEYAMCEAMSAMAPSDDCWEDLG